MHTMIRRSNRIPTPSPTPMAMSRAGVVGDVAELLSSESDVDADWEFEVVAATGARVIFVVPVDVMRLVVKVVVVGDVAVAL